uniref:Uncharacterized protein n=1 Tax=Meloidogyne incognita TaxID=6306 RepID=A0A914LA44_MELIC
MYLVIWKGGNVAEMGETRILDWKVNLSILLEVFNFTLMNNSKNGEENGRM